MAKLVAKTYGEALFQLALENGELDLIHEEIQVAFEVLKKSDDLIRFLNHPNVSKDEKINALEEMFQGKFSNTTIGFFVIIVEKGRYNELYSIFEYFIQLVREHKKFGTAYVASATELTMEQKEKIENKLLKTTDYISIDMEYSVDPSLLGGLVIRIGDRVVDSSLRLKLDLLKKELLKIQLAN